MRHKHYSSLASLLTYKIADPRLVDPRGTLNDLLIQDKDRIGKGPVYKLESSPGKGMGLFATEHIPKGAKILQERPVITCQTLDGPKGPEHNTRYLLGFVTQVFALSPQLQREVFALKGEQPSVPPPSMARFRAILDDHFSHPDGSKLSWRESRRLQDAVRIFYTNAAAMYEGSSTWWFWRPTSLGDGLFLTFSRMNHSCEPNASWDTDLHGRPGVMSVWAERDIGEGEEITISYIPVHGRSVEKRRQMLRRWGFECRCEKCGSRT